MQNKAKLINVSLEYDQFNIGGQIEQTVLDENGELDLPRVKALFKTRFDKKHFDYVACDYDLSNTINGVELLRSVGNELFGGKGRYIIYSGLINEIIKDAIISGCKINQNEEGVPNIIPEDHLIKYFKHLINANYLAFVDRGDLVHAILRKLKDDISIDDVLDEIISQYPDKKIKYGFNHGLEGKTMSEVKNLIKNDDDLRIGVMRDLFEQSIIFLSEKMMK